MKAIKLSLIAGAVGVAGALCLSAQAQPASTVLALATADVDMTDAEVRKVDKENKKVTLRHGAIKNLDMPPMTMVFPVSDPSMLDNLQAGDKVRFRATSVGGTLVVTDIQHVK
jgi:Cu(I)/Ag(I) efflux system protein CusF